MRRPHRQNRQAFLRQGERLVPSRGRRVDQVRSPGLHLRRRVDRQGPLTPGPIVARPRWADAGFGESSTFGGAGGRVQGGETMFGRDLADMRMIDNDEVVAPRQSLDREGFEILQRATVPFDFDAGLLAPEPRASRQRVVAAWMVPRHSAQGHVASEIDYPSRGESLPPAKDRLTLLLEGRPSFRRILGRKANR